MTITATKVIAHLGVWDMPTSIAFYCDILGFTIVNQAGPGDEFGWGLLRLGDTEIMLNTQYDQGERPAEQDPRRIAAHEDTTLYFDCTDVDAAYEHVRAKGIEAKPPAVSWYGMKQLYLMDPDGYLICFHCPQSDPATVSV